MTKTFWYDHFKNQADGASAAFAKEPPGISLLAFCLKNKILSSTEYLAWAMETHQTPVLGDGFFIVHAPTPEFFQKYQSFYSWNAECLPVAEWEGLLIVAGLEKPLQLPAESIFVFTSYENLTKAWAHSHSTPVQENSAVTTFSLEVSKAEENPTLELEALVATPEASAEAAPSESFINEDGEIVLQDTGSNEEDSGEEKELKEHKSGEGEEEISASSEEEEVEGVPDGLFAEVLSTGPSPTASLNNFVGIQLVPQATPPPPAPEETVDLSNKTAIREDSVIETSLKPQTAPPMSMHEEMLQKSLQANRIAAIDTLPSDEEPEEEVTATRRMLNGALVNNEDLPNAPMKMTQAPPMGAAAYFLEKVRKQNQESFDKEVLASFNQCKTFFKKSMLLAIGDKDRVVKPILWDGGDFDVRKPAVVEFSLKTPSIFRIVSGTQKPYHGYVVANELNESFFESWNHGQIPDHVTIVPLMDHDLVVGMLVGLGEKSSYNKSVLQFSEGVAKELSRKILKATAKAA